MRALRTLVLAALVAAGLSLAPRLAQAYPQFQLSTGAQRCNQCHIAPTGGTLLSGYGRDEAGDTISRGGDGSFLHGAWAPPDWQTTEFHHDGKRKDFQSGSASSPSFWPLRHRS